MKKVLSVVVLLSLFLPAIAQKSFVVDANAEMRTLNGSFNSIKDSQAIDLYLSQSDNESIAVSASDEKYKAGIKTVVENNVLKIYYDGAMRWGTRNLKMKA